MAEKMYLYHPNGDMEHVRLTSTRVGAGGTADVLEVEGRADLVAKFYREPGHARDIEKKVRVMLARSVELPLAQGGGLQSSIVWPTGLLLDLHHEFRGFAMRRIDRGRSVSLNCLFNSKIRQRHGLPQEAGFRLRCGLALCRLLEALHAQGHYVIDLKDANILVDRAEPAVHLLDSDGFCILGPGNQRFPARHVTPEYTAPEGVSTPAEQLRGQQDAFALAVLLFQLVNEGIHPFQGIPKGFVELPSENQGKINRRLYAYGWEPHPQIAPVPLSLHAHLPPELRNLFDRAFIGRERPAPTEWRQCLESLEERLRPCRADRNHLRVGRRCVHCSSQGRLSPTTGGLLGEWLRDAAGSILQSMGGWWRHSAVFRLALVAGSGALVSLGAATLRSSGMAEEPRLSPSSPSGNILSVTSNVPGEVRVNGRAIGHVRHKGAPVDVQLGAGEGGQVVVEFLGVDGFDFAFDRRTIVLTPDRKAELKFEFRKVRAVFKPPRGSTLLGVDRQSYANPRSRVDRDTYVGLHVLTLQASGSGAQVEVQYECRLGDKGGECEMFRTK
ncbi:protein kinase domain-containing protein [Archangium violaceum]|uniref:protein kinase domain-containing protein n=1 Tax=Archangium violaceum TaxID=83451 RepID=UPI0036DBBE6A